MRNMEAILALEDGTWFRGAAAGADGEARGEVVFNTSMTGYQEVLTDPSYAGQIVTMTYPHIGNYGVNPRDMESARAQGMGFVAREIAELDSSYRSGCPIQSWLAPQGILGTAGSATRRLTRT